MTFRIPARSLAVVALAVASIGGAAAAPFPEFEDNCGTAPYGPEIKVSTPLPSDKVAELRKDVVDFIKASDQFQDCISKMLDKGPAFKKTDDTPEKRIAIAERFEREATRIIDENQSEKERVGNDFNKFMDFMKTADKPK